MVVRLVGTDEEEGRRLLADANLITATSLVDAAKKAVAASKVADLPRHARPGRRAKGKDN